MSLIVSPVVRKNLERAFTRSLNKLEWFENLRRLGVSQDFYEYVLDQLKVPIAWLVEDLRAGRVKATTKIRSHLKDRIQIVVPGEEISPTEIILALEFLTPVEKQESLVSRFLIVLPEGDMMTDEVLSLLWDIRDSVGTAVVDRWAEAISKNLSHKMNLSSVEKLWAKQAWANSELARAELSPARFDELSEMWPKYLDDLMSAGEIDRIPDCLTQIADERLKIQWIQIFDDLGRIKDVEKGIRSIRDRYTQLKFLARLSLQNEVSLLGIGILAEALAESAITLDQLSLAHEIVKLLLKAELSPTTRALEILNSAEAVLDCYKISISDERIEIARKWHLSTKVWSLLVRRWATATVTEKEVLIPQIVDMSKDSKFFEEGQRLLVELILAENQPSDAINKALDALLSDESHLRIKHLRREFIEKATIFDPLHREILRFRAAYDHRSVLVWNSFYGDALPSAAAAIVYNKRKFILWKTVRSFCRSAVPQSLKVYEGLRKELVTDLEPCDELEKLASKLSQLFGKRQSLSVCLSDKTSKPIAIQFDPDILILRKSSRYLFDDELLKSFLYAYVQLKADYDSGLYQSDVLTERFFIGMLLSGTSLSKMIRFLVSVSKEENIFREKPESMEPERLIREAPMLRDFLGFYLGDEYSKMVENSGISLT